MAQSSAVGGSPTWRAVAEARNRDSSAVFSKGNDVTWHQEEEVYSRLAAEMALMESRGFPRNPSRSPAPAPPPVHRSMSTQQALEHPPWEQEEEVYHRLKYELQQLEMRRESSKMNLSGDVQVGQAPGEKWIPKSNMHRSPSTQATLEHPPWEQEQEVYQRLVDELKTLEARADAHLHSQRSGGVGGYPTYHADRTHYGRVDLQLRSMEIRGVGPAPPAAGMGRSGSRGSLLPPGTPEEASYGQYAQRA